MDNARGDTGPVPLRNREERVEDMKRRVFAALLSLVLVLGVVPSAAFAEYGADAEGSAVEADQMDGGAQNGQDSDPDQIPGGDAVPDPDGEDDAVQDPAPGSELEDPDENGDAGDPEGDKTPEEEPEEPKLTLPETTASLQAISGRDEEGQLKIYTTLYDEKQRIIDTNDPDEEQSAYYKNGGTVARGAVCTSTSAWRRSCPTTGKAASRKT